jgi:branched-subunit amino acid transport protein
VSTWLVILTSGVATYLTRVAGLVLDLDVPAKGLRRYLDALPAAIIAALVGRAVIAPDDALTRGAEPLAALAVVLVARWRRDLLSGTLAGVIAIALLRAAGIGS